MKFLTLAFLLSLTLTTAHAEFEDCDGKLSTALARLLESDSRGILALQYKLTTLKMTKRLLGANKKTIESAVRADHARLQAFNAEDPAILTRLNQLFNENGGDTHRAILQDRVRELKADSLDASYWRADKRLSNQDISTYLMMDKMSNAQSEVNDQDIAIAWFMQKVSDQVATSRGRHSAAHNLTLMSAQLARNLGSINGVAALSAAETGAQIASAQTTINDFLTSAVASIKTAIPECFRDNKFKGTADCDINFLSNALAEQLMNMENVSAFLPSLERASVAMARNGSAPLRPVVAPARAIAGRPPVVRAPDPRRQVYNSAIDIVYRSDMNSHQERFTCPNGRSFPLRTTDLNHNRGNYRFTILLNGQLRTLRREQAANVQIECMAKLVTRNCFPDTQVNEAACFY